MTGISLLAQATCEQPSAGWLVYPVEGWSSLAFVVAGVVVAARTSQRWIPWALAAIGVGSFLFDGTDLAGSEWVHDVALAWLLVVAWGAAANRERVAGWPALAVIGITFAVLPGVAEAASVAIGIGAVATILLHDRSPRTLGALALLGAGAVVSRLSVPGRPWCNPESLLQGHAVWHVAAATAVAIWALGLPSATTRSDTSSRDEAVTG